MSENAFNDKSVVPDGSKVLKALGRTGKLWLEIRRHVQEKYAPAIEEWKYYGPKSGWTMKLISKQRNLFFFTASEGGFRLAFVFGDKAVEQIEKSDLPKNIIDEVRNTTKYVEGRGLLLEVKDEKTVAAVKTLIKIKVES